MKSDFATRLYEKLSASESGKNVFFSPFSIQVALAMCARGAKGETRKVLAELIDAPADLTTQDIAYRKLLNLVNGKDRPYQLATANSLWGQNDFEFYKVYQDAVRENYDGEFTAVDFKKSLDETIKVINTWVEEKTNNRIKDLLKRGTVDEQTKLVLVNAIYFKGDWLKAFDEKDTKEEDFNTASGKVKCQMMKKKSEYSYYENKDYQAISIPYAGNELSMLVVLPRNQDGLTAVEKKWKEDNLYQQTVDGMIERYVILSLPRFKMETEFNLSETLKDMGARLAFQDNADLTLISEKPLKISEVVHKAFVEVTEKGTEAAAATAVVCRMCCTSVGSMPPPPVIFKADHPFMFFIRHNKTNQTLFSGRMLTN